nr:coat protein [Aplosporella javeedii partitivirus 1]
MSASTKAFSLKNSSKLRDKASRFDRPPVPELSETPVVPLPRNNFFRDLDLPNRIHFDNALDAVIDVVPDVRYCLIFIVYHVAKLYTSKQNHSVYTPSSTVAYCLLQLYAFMLLNDVHGRSTPSAHATDFLGSESNIDYLKILLGSYVPPFMMDLFHGLTDCLDPRRPGIQYISTLAASVFNYDFGRLIPPGAFIYAHNQSCDEDTSRNVKGATQSLLAQVLFTTTSGVPISVGNYFSAGFSDNTFCRTWIFELLKLVFSPVTGRSLVKDLFFEEIPFSSQNLTRHTPDNDSDSNPYTHYLHASSANTVSMKRFMQKMSSIVQTEFNAKFQLGAVPADLSGVNILVHGYSPVSLPTWHSRPLNDDFSLKTSRSVDEYAAAIKFKILPPYTKGKATMPYPPEEKSFLSGLYLVKNQKHDPTSEPLPFDTFNDEKDVFPRTYYLDPYTEGEGPIGYSMIAGLLIESDEVDGSSVHQPNSRIPLAPNNRHFLSGSLPMSQTRLSYDRSSSASFSVHPRTIMQSREISINHDLYCVGTNILGQFDSDCADDSVSQPSGFTLKSHIRSLSDMFSKISFYLSPKSGRTISPPDNFHAAVWSPYRHILDETDDYPTTDAIHVIFNLRTLFGENIPLVGSRHPAELMPSS